MEETASRSLTTFMSLGLSVTFIKLLLIPSYRSTDFEVHRNWLAITHSLPLNEWYIESTSKWTLDYPPLFAWFEYALSQVAARFDPKMVVISSKPYSSLRTIYFQRGSVIVSDLLYFYAAYQWCRLITEAKSGSKLSIVKFDGWFSPTVLLSMLFLWNPGLLIVDHIHFQYNGLLSGLLLLSMARMVEGKHLESALWFSILLNFKHIYLYVAPVYFIYLLRNYCYDRYLKFNRKNFITLGVVVGSVFAFSFGPFIVTGQMGQLLKRLFPFKRGLSHAYWAPNFWAIYNAVDKVLAILSGKKSTGSMTSGLVQEYNHQVLPNVAPAVTVVLMVLAMLPALHNLWKQCHFYHETTTLFVRTLVICGYCSFLFGWHVHEKAILMVILPLTPLAVLTKKEANIFLLLSVTGTFSLFPLLYRMVETPTKILLLLMYCIYAFKSLHLFHCNSAVASTSRRSKGDQKSPSLFSPSESIYLLGFIGLQLFSSFGCQALGLEAKFQFLPLMSTSVYCSLGVIYSWIKMYAFILKGEANQIIVCN